MIFGKIVALFLLYSSSGAYDSMPCFGENYLPDSSLEHRKFLIKMRPSAKQRFPSDEEINLCLDKHPASYAVGLEHDFIATNYGFATGRQHGITAIKESEVDLTVATVHLHHQKIIDLIKASKVAQVEKMLAERKKVLLDGKKDLDRIVGYDQADIKKLDKNTQQLAILQKELSEISENQQRFIKAQMRDLAHENAVILSKKETSRRQITQEALNFVNDEIDTINKVTVNLKVFNNPSKALDEMQKFHDKYREMLNKHEFTSLIHRMSHLRDKANK